MIIHKAGRSTRIMELKRYGVRVALVMAGLLVCWVFIRLIPISSSWTSVPLILALFVGFKIFDRWLHGKIDHVHKREKDAARGASAEESVGEILDALDKDRFQVFHDVVLGYGNMDHIVLRRDGAVFMIETKSQAGKISYDGQKLLRDGHPLENVSINQTVRNYLRLGEHLGRYAEREVWVNGILCFTKGFIQVRGRIKGVHVLNAKWLLKGLEEGRANPDLADWLWEHFGVMLSSH